MTIKSIIISGGAYLGLCELGCIHTLLKNNIINLTDIESFYATSVGVIISVIISLKLDWELLYDYFVFRPWYKLIDTNIEKILNIFNTKGLIEEEFFISLLKPLFDYKEINIDITLKKFEEIVGYKFNIFTCCFNNFDLININSNDYPDIKLIKAINMTCCIPALFKPVEYNNNLYIDGGLIQGYPLIQSLNNYKKDEIFGIRFNFLNNKNKKSEETNLLLEEMNLFEFIFRIISKMGRYISRDTYPIIKNEIVIEYSDINYQDLEKCLNTQEKRIELIQLGINKTNDYINSLKQLDLNQQQEDSCLNQSLKIQDLHLQDSQVQVSQDQDYFEVEF